MTDFDDTTGSAAPDADEQLVAEATAGHDVLTTSDADHVASLWDGIAAAAFDDVEDDEDLEERSIANSPATDGDDETPPPHLAAVAGAQDEAGGPSAITPDVANLDNQRAKRPNRGPTRWLAAAAAAAAIVFVAGGVWLVTQPTGQPVASFAMEPLDNRVAGQVDGTIVADGDATQVEVDLSGLPTLGTDEFYELWLLDLDAGLLVSLGEVDATTTTVAIDQPVDPTAFPVIDVSVEPAAGPADHSGDSVLRGPITAADSPG